MDPEVILFFVSVLAAIGMLCWTTVAVTQKIIAYKTLSLQAGNTQSGPQVADGEAPMATLEHAADEGNA